jgi:magnesium chelatase family protein
MLARRFPSILPPLEPEEAVEVTRLHSLAGQIKPDDFGGRPLVLWPPFRSPHHSASAEGILGGGRTVRPGEITLAQFGTLFLDEATEFRGAVLQSLREPLEDRVITIVRAEGHMKLPADFQLILAANSCPCGRLGAVPSDYNPPDSYPPDVNQKDSGSFYNSGCFCTIDEIHRYWRKLGSALLDRIEIRVPVSAPGILTPGSVSGEESSAEIRRRVTRAVEIQRKRFTVSIGLKSGGSKSDGLRIRRNSGMSPGQIERFCQLTDKAVEVFSLAATRLGLSGRACHGVLKIARTIADLAGKESIDTAHILEAVQYRRFGDDPYDILTADK